MSGYAASPVLFTKENGARLVTLNRPEKLNALTPEMISQIEPRLGEYAKLASATMVILKSSSNRALCAGGDVHTAVRLIKDGNAKQAAEYFQEEYNLNYLISTFLKPFVAVMDGITFGGGVGLSVHAPFRVATERTQVAMPEMDIGFFPDVGSCFFLSRMDDHLGYYYALTGHVSKGIDAYFAGFATHYVPLDRITPLISRLLELTPPSEGENAAIEFYALVNAAINDFADATLPSDYSLPHTTAEIQTISSCFSQKTIEAIFAALRDDGSDFAAATLAELEAKPLSLLKLALALLHRAEKNSIKAQLQLDTIAATNIVTTDLSKSDFVAGVAHKLIDKIRNPAHPVWPGESSDTWVQETLSLSDATKQLAQPLINSYFKIDYRQYPHHMGLPRNHHVQAYICGTDGLNRSYLPTKSEVIVHFSRTFPKLGVAECVKRILDVHGESSSYDEKYVCWK